MTLLILGLVLFLGTHSVQIAAPALRERAIAGGGGTRAWMLSYMAISGIGLVLVIIGYGMARHDAPLLYHPPTALRHLTLLVMLPVFPLLIATYLKGRIGQLLGHPMLIATMLWAVAHLMANGNLADVLLFGSFLVWAALDWQSLLRRESSASPRAGANWGRNDAIAIIVGLAIYLAFIGGVHALLVGVSPL